MERRMEEMELQRLLDSEKEMLHPKSGNGLKFQSTEAEAEAESSEGALRDTILAENGMILQKEAFHEEVEAAVRELRMEDGEAALRDLETRLHSFYSAHAVSIPFNTNHGI